MRARIFQIVHRACEGDRVSRAYDAFMVIVAFASIIPAFFHLDALPLFAQAILTVLDLVAVYILAFDYVLRWMTHDLEEGTPRNWKSFVRYPFTPVAIIDLLAILPSLNVLPAGFLFLRALRVFRIFRYSRHLSVIANVFYQERRTLSLVLLLACLYIFVTALIMFTLEADTFDNFIDALYWSAITLTTIGFGDIYPLTDAGRVVTIFSSLFGIFVLALPAGIMTGSFLRQLQIRREDGERYFDGSFVGGIDWSYFLFTPTRVRDFFNRNPKVRAFLATMTAGVGVNFALYAVVSLATGRLFWLDTTGTAIVACALGPAAGIVVSFVNNLVLAILTGNAGNLLYIGESVAVALAYGLLLPLGENGKRPKGKALKVLGIVIAVRTAISFGLVMVLADGGLATAYEQFYRQFFLGVGVPFAPATVFALLIGRTIDSLLVFCLVAAACKFVGKRKWNPRRWLVAHGVCLEEDFSQCIADIRASDARRKDIEGTRARAAIRQMSGFADDGRLGLAAGVLEGRARDCVSEEYAGRYKAGAAALRILQNDDVRDEEEFGRLFDALVFGAVKPASNEGASSSEGKPSGAPAGGVREDGSPACVDES